MRKLLTLLVPAKNVLFLLVFAALAAGSAFAQSVGDTGTFNGQNYRVTEVRGNRVVLEKVEQRGGRRMEQQMEQQGDGVMIQSARSEGDRVGFLTLNSSGTGLVLGTRGSANFADSSAVFTFEDAGDGWSRIRTSSGGYVRLTSADSRSPLDVVSRRDNSVNLKFMLEDAGDGTFYLKSAAGNDSYIHVNSAKVNDNTKALRYKGKHADGKWRVVRSRSRG